MLQQRPRRASAALFLCLFAAGCASTTTGKAGISPGRSDGLVYVVSEGTPEFKVTKPDYAASGVGSAAGAVGGVVGALVVWGIVHAISKAMDKGGDQIVALAPQDALAWLRPRLIRNLEAEATLAGTRWVDGQPTTDVPGSVLTLKLDKWGLRADKSDSDAFLPVLAVTATLVKGSERVWQGECEARREHVAPPLHTLAELGANNNGRLRDVMTRALEACADELTARFLGRATPELRGPGKLEVKVTGRSLSAVEAMMLGTREAPGLAAGRFEARFSELTLTNPDLGTLQRLFRESMTGPGDAELKLDGTLDGQPFEAKLERNSAGRARLKFEGLRFAAEPDVDTFLDAFARPGLRRVEFDGEAGGRRVKRSRP